MNYQLYLTTTVDPESLKDGSGILVLESSNYSKAAIEQIKNKGYKVLGYISIGTIEKKYNWYKTYKKYSLDSLEDRLNKTYVDVREKEWRDFIIRRAKEIKESKDIDGWWCDDLDIYEYYSSSKMFVACASVISRIKKLGGYLMVNGGSKFFDYALNHDIDLSTVDGVTQKEVYSSITSYKGSGKFSRQKKSSREFYEKLLNRLKKRGIETYLLEYTRNNDVKVQIKKAKVTGYYISESINL